VIALLAAVAAGSSLYAMRCASCHGAQLQGSGNGPPLVHVSAPQAEFWLGTRRMPARLPYGEIVPQPQRLTSQQIKALELFVVAQSGGSAAMPRLGGTGDLSRGRQLFVADCAACHGVAAQGGATGYGWTAPSLGNVTPDHIADAVRIGPGVMPRFNQGELSDRDLDDVIRYVLWVRQLGVWQRGGLSLGDDGPVAEGAIAWLLGLGILVLVARSFGTKA
jgi:ubiquinol-cytochrome c reductase cytochrome c subunit